MATGFAVGTGLAAAAVAIAMLAVLVAYLRRPPWRDYRPSAARFLQGIGGEVPPAVRFDPRRLLARWRLWLRLGALALVLVALVDLLSAPIATGDRRIGLLVVVDTSYSMTADSGAGTRFDEAAALLRRLVDALAAAPEGVAACSRVLLVDDQVRDAGPLGGAIPVPRPRGGSTALLGAAVRRGMEPSGGAQDCPPTDVIVVTDLPRPAAAVDGTGGADGPAPFWLTVGRPAANAGIVQARLAGGGDGPSRVEVTVAADAAPPALEVAGPGGRRFAAMPVEPPGDGRFARYGFVPDVSGEYRVRLDGGGAYAGDDAVAVEVADARTLAVVWNSRAPWPARPDWRREEGPATAADLAVTAAEDAFDAAGATGDDEAPGAARSLLTYPWQPATGAGPATVGLFLDDHPILEGVSLDVFERLAPRPFPRLPDGFGPVLTDPQGRPWVAASGTPPAVLLPEWRAADDRDAANMIDTLFFNALRWLVEDVRPQLRVEWLTPDGTAIPGGAGEWTEGRAGALPELPALAPDPNAAEPRPLWPWLVLLAALLTLVDRLTSLTERRA